MTVKKLTSKQKILVAGTLFGMFFGAGNLIFPVHLGQMAGSNVIPAIIGFIITAVGIPKMCIRDRYGTDRSYSVSSKSK